MTIYVSFVFPLVFGIILIYQSFKKSSILVVNVKNKRKCFSLRKFEKNEELKNLIDFLKTKYSNKLDILL